MTKLAKTGAPFTITDVCNLSGVGRTFIYDNKHPELTSLVTEARDRSRRKPAVAAETRLKSDEASWRARALNSENLAKSLRQQLRASQAQVAALIGQLHDPDGTSLVTKLAEITELTTTLSTNLRKSEQEVASLRRSLDAARAQVKRERERNVATLIYSQQPDGRSR